MSYLRYRLWRLTGHRWFGPTLMVRGLDFTTDAYMRSIKRDFIQHFGWRDKAGMKRYLNDLGVLVGDNCIEWLFDGKTIPKVEYTGRSAAVLGKLAKSHADLSDKEMNYEQNYATYVRFDTHDKALLDSLEGCMKYRTVYEYTDLLGDHAVIVTSIIELEKPSRRYPAGLWRVEAARVGD